MTIIDFVADTSSSCRGDYESTNFIEEAEDV